MGYIKIYKIVVLIDFGSTCNFFQKNWLTNYTIVYMLAIIFKLWWPMEILYPMGKCCNVKPTMGDYQFMTYMFTLSLGRTHVALGV
jgi:hypothetical protein